MALIINNEVVQNIESIIKTPFYPMYYIKKAKQLFEKNDFYINYDGPHEIMLFMQDKGTKLAIDTHRYARFNRIDLIGGDIVNMESTPDDGEYLYHITHKNGTTYELRKV